MSRFTDRLRLRSSDTAARFLATYRPSYNEPVEVAVSSAKAFREVVLSHVRRLTPRFTGDIHMAVIDDWGETCRRRVERALRRLVADGLVVRGPNGRGYLLGRAS